MWLEVSLTSVVLPILQTSIQDYERVSVLFQVAEVREKPVCLSVYRGLPSVISTFHWESSWTCRWLVNQRTLCREDHKRDAYTPGIVYFSLTHAQSFFTFSSPSQLGCLIEIPRSLSHILTPTMPHLWFLNVSPFKVRPTSRRHAKYSESRVLRCLPFLPVSYNHCAHTSFSRGICSDPPPLLKAFQRLQCSVQRYCNCPWRLIFYCSTHYSVTGTRTAGTDTVEITGNWLWISPRGHRHTQQCWWGATRWEGCTPSLCQGWGRGLHVNRASLRLA